MNGSSPTIRDQLTGGQEMADQMLFRMFTGLPMPGINQNWAQALGMPRGVPFPVVRQGGNPQPISAPPGTFPTSGPGAGSMQGVAGPSPIAPGNSAAYGGGQPPVTQIGQPTGTGMGPVVPPSGLGFDPQNLQALSQVGSFHMPQAVGTPFPVNAPINPTLANAQQWTQQLNPTQGIPEAWKALQPAMAGQRSMNFSPLQGPAALQLSNLNPLPNLQLRQQRAGPDLNLPTYNPLQNLNIGAVKPADQIGFDKFKADTGYRYQNYNAKDVAANLGQVTDKYNFKPGTVQSTLDNKGNTQKYFQEGVMNPLLRQYDTAIAPRISDALAGAGNTFSTRANTARQSALQDLQTQAAAQLSSAVRQDEIERSQQNLAAQQFNVGTAAQNAQFGGQLQQGYDLANSQRALNIAGMNLQNQQFGQTANTAGQFNQAQFLNQLMSQQASQNNQARNAAAQINNQASQFAQNLNSQNQLQQFGLNTQNQLGFAGLNSQNALQAGQLNNQNRQFFSNLDQQGQLAAYNANVQNQLGFGGLNTQRALGAAQLNNASRLGYDTLNTQTQMGLAEAAANRQMQSAGLGQDVINNQWNRAMQQAQSGMGMQQMDQQRQAAMMQDFLRQAPENNPWLQMLMQYRGMPTNQMGFRTPGVMDQIMGGLGAAQGVAGLAGMLPMMGAGLFGTPGAAATGTAAAIPATSGLIGGIGSALGGLGSGLGAAGSGLLGLLGLI